MVSAEKCLQLKVRETGQRGGRGQIHIFSDSSQYKPGSWLYKSPFTEVVAIHQTQLFNRLEMDVLCPKGYSWTLGERDHTKTKVGWT